MPSTKKQNFAFNKILNTSTRQCCDDSNIVMSTVASPSSFRDSNSLEQRVQEFNKTAKYMIRKLEATKEKIDACIDDER